MYSPRVWVWESVAASGVDRHADPSVANLGSSRIASCAVRFVQAQSCGLKVLLMHIVETMAGAICVRELLAVEWVAGWLSDPTDTGSPDWSEGGRDVIDAAAYRHVQSVGCEARQV